MDKRGEGIPVILSASGRLSGVRPEYRLLGESELLLTISSAPVDNRKKLREIVLKKTTQVTTQVTPKTTEVAPETTQVADDTTQVTTQVKELLLGLKGELSVDEMRQRAHIADRRDFRKRYLAPALVSGYVEMTQPNSPRSPTQKYRLTDKGRSIINEINGIIQPKWQT